jgi:hypothetical protein
MLSKYPKECILTYQASLLWCISTSKGDPLFYCRGYLTYPLKSILQDIYARTSRRKRSHLQVYQRLSHYFGRFVKNKRKSQLNRGMVYVLFLGDVVAKYDIHMWSLVRNKGHQPTILLIILIPFLHPPNSIDSFSCCWSRKEAPNVESMYKFLCRFVTYSLSLFV